MGHGLCTNAPQPVRASARAPQPAAPPGGATAAPPLPSHRRAAPGRGGGAGPGGACADRDQSAAPASRLRSILRAGAVPRRLRTGCRIPPQRGPWRRSPASTPASVSGAWPRGEPRSAALSSVSQPLPIPISAVPEQAAGGCGGRRWRPGRGTERPLDALPAPRPARPLFAPPRGPRGCGAATEGRAGRGGPLPQPPPPLSSAGPRRARGVGGERRGVIRRLAPVRWVPATLKNPIAAPSVLQHRPTFCRGRGLSLTRGYRVNFTFSSS